MTSVIRRSSGTTLSTETHAIRLLRTDRRAGEEHAAEQPLWDVTRHVRGAAAAADIDLGQPEGRVLRRDANVRTLTRSTQPAPSAGPFTAAITGIAQCRTDWNMRRTINGPCRIVLDLGGEELAQIKTRTERPRAARQQHGAVDVAKCADLLEHLRRCADKARWSAH